MKYLPTIDLWNSAVSSALRNGNLRLQTGQWVSCGDPENPSRFVRATRYSVWAVHPNGDKVTMARFKDACAAAGRATL